MPVLPAQRHLPLLFPFDINANTLHRNGLALYEVSPPSLRQEITFFIKKSSQIFNAMKNIVVFITLIVSLLFQYACEKNNGIPPADGLEQYSNEVVLDWNVVSFEAMGGAAAPHGLAASRAHAMMHLAMHDALNAIAPRYQTYAYHQKNKQANPIAAMATAAYEVLVVVADASQKPALDSHLAASLAKVPEGDSKKEGIELGKKTAAAILEARKNDAASQNPISPIPPSTGQPGIYQAVPPFDFVFAPFWSELKPFSLESPDQFRVEPHPAINSVAYATAFEEIKRIGKKDSPDRSNEQTAIAKFWYEDSDIGWNRVTRTIAQERKTDLLATARLFALVNMALADAYIAGWDSKFHYNFWRPYSAIRAAETDGNPNTVADLQWESGEVNPPVQDYPSTHSALGNAGATVLTALLGDNVSFTMTSTTANPAGSTRTNPSFLQAADENAESRVLAGIHFRFSCEKGQELGNKIGAWTVKNHLKPLE